MVYVLLGKGFEETEAIAPIDLMRRAGIPVLTVGIGSKTVIGGHGIGVVADLELAQVDPTALDMVILPGLFCLCLFLLCGMAAFCAPLIWLQLGIDLDVFQDADHILLMDRIPEPEVLRLELRELTQRSFQSPCGDRLHIAIGGL